MSTPTFDYKRRRFSSEVDQPSAALSRFFGAFAKGWLSWGAENSVDVAPLLPQSTEIHVFPDIRTMHAALKSINVRPPSWSRGATVRDFGIFVVDDGTARSFHLAGHEFTHWMSRKSKNFAGSVFGREMFTELMTAFIMMSHMDPPMGRHFSAGYHGIAIIGDELIRAASLIDRRTPKQLLNLIIKGHLTGDQAPGEAIIRRTLGDGHRWRWFKFANPSIGERRTGETEAEHNRRAQLGALVDADMLGLPDAVRRLHQTFSGFARTVAISVLEHSPWHRRPQPMVPLSPEERAQLLPPGMATTLGPGEVVEPTEIIDPSDGDAFGARRTDPNSEPSTPSSGEQPGVDDTQVPAGGNPREPGSPEGGEPPPHTRVDSSQGARDSMARRLAAQLTEIDDEIERRRLQVRVDVVLKLNDALATLRSALVLADAAYEEAKDRESRAQAKLHVAQAEVNAATASPDMVVPAEVEAAQRRAAEAQEEIDQARLDQDHLRAARSEDRDNPGIGAVINSVASARDNGERAAAALGDGSDWVRVWAATALTIPIGTTDGRSGTPGLLGGTAGGYVPYGAWPEDAPFEPEPPPDPSLGATGAPEEGMTPNL